MDKSKEKPKANGDIDAGMAKLKSELHRDDKFYPEREYMYSQASFREWSAKIHGLLAGGIGLYEQKDKFQTAFKWLSRIEQALSFFGSIPAIDVQRMIAAFQQRIVSILMLEEPLPKSIYPRANNGRLRSCLEMAHEFFNLGKDQRIEIKNNNSRDHSYWGGMLPGDPPQYRLPAGGGWVSIPPFIPDSRPGVPSQGFFHTGAELFMERSVLEIRIVKKSESHPPVSVLEEKAAVEAAKKTKAAEFAELINAIAKGDE